MDDPNYDHCNLEEKDTSKRGITWDPKLTQTKRTWPSLTIMSHEFYHHQTSILYDSAFGSTPDPPAQALGPCHPDMHSLQSIGARRGHGHCLAPFFLLLHVVPSRVKYEKCSSCMCCVVTSHSHIYIYMLHNKYIYIHILIYYVTVYGNLPKKRVGIKSDIANVWSCPILWDQEEGSSTGEFIFNWHQLERHEVHKLVPQSFGHHRLTLGFLGLWGFTFRTWYKKTSQLSKQLWINFRFVPAIWQWSNDHSRKSM